MELSALVVAAVIISCIVYAITWWYRRLKLKDLRSRYVLITGCDTGFGARCARKMDRQGIHVFAACLTEHAINDLRESCSSRLVPVRLDVTNDEMIADALMTVKEHLPAGKGLWALINNAGITGPVSLCGWLNKEDFMPSLQVNVLGMASVTNAFLPLLRQERGRIINTASVMGRFAVPPAPYTVLKYCVEAYTDCLRRELRDQGISVHTIEPGGYQSTITDTNLASQSLKKTFHQLKPEEQQFYGERYYKWILTTVVLGTSFLACPRLDEVVDVYIHAVTARFPKTRYVVGLNANFIFRPLWTLPSWLSDFFVGMTFPRPQGTR